VTGGISSWLEEVGLGQYAESFARNDIDFDVLPELTEDDLKELGLSLGHRRKLVKAIAALPRSPEPLPSGEPARAKPEAERRQLTLVFVDLVESTALSHRLDPEELAEVIRGYHDVVVAEISRLEGYVAKFMGDGVLVYFGFPRAHEDDAERAVRSALAIVEAVRGLRLRDDEPLRVRVGIATGSVVVGDLIGEGAAQEQAVTGEAPNLAARLQGLAGANHVLIDGNTRRLIGDAFELEDLGLHELKGFPHAVAAWMVRRERTTESRFEAAHSGTLTRFVGREHELGLMRERWAAAKAGEGQIVLLAGEAGMGKSRILQAFRDEIAAEPHFDLRYQCSPQHANSAFHPVIRHLEHAAGFAGDEAPEAKLGKLLSLLEGSLPDGAGALPLFAALLSLPVAERDGGDLTPEQRRERTIEAMAEQVLTLSKRRPVLLVLEDAHWIDPSTGSFIGELVAKMANAAILALVTHRPGYVPAWSRHPHVACIALNRLSRKQSIEIVRAVAGTRDIPDGIVERIIARADGVPFYVEELTKSLVEAGEASDGPNAGEFIPSTLQALLIARLDRLGAAKDTAQVGSVLGREFSYGLLKAVAGASDAEINLNLGRLVESELVYQRGVVPGATYIFKHALVQDTAYETLLLRRRQQLHARVAEILEQLFPEIMRTEPETLAHHYARASNADKAVLYLGRFAVKAAAMYAHAEALAALEEAQAHAERLGEPERNRVLLDLALRRAESLHFLGRRQEIVELLIRQQERLELLHDSALAGQYYFWLGFAHSWLGHRQEAARDLGRSLEESTRAGDEAMMGRTHRALATECLYSGRRLPEMIRHAHEAAALLTRAKDNFWLSQALFTLSYACTFAGDFAGALEAAERLEALGQATGIRRAQANGAMMAGLARAMRGEGEAAIVLCERALELSPDDFETSFVLACLGRSCWEASDVARAISSLERAVQLARRVRSVQFCAFFLTLLGEAFLLGGESEKALGAAREALDVSLRVGFRLGVGLSRHVMAKTSKSAGNLAEAQNDLDEALRIFAELGARFEQARALFDLADLAYAQQRPDAVAANLAQAQALFAALDVPKYAERARRSGAEFGVPVAVPVVEGVTPTL
jgi:class 3 adenylate cyclase/tetratricopeptide (TPR) repeat protein